MLIAPLSGPKPGPIQPVPPVRRRPQGIHASVERLSVGFDGDSTALTAHAGAERQARARSFGASPLSAQTAFAVMQVGEQAADPNNGGRAETGQSLPASGPASTVTASKAATAAYAQGLRASPGFAFARPADVLNLVA